MLTQEELKNLLHYDPETGLFTHLTTRHNAVKIGQRAGTEHTDLSGKKYIYIKVLGRKYRAHRLVWLYIYGVFPENEIDHEDGDGTNNVFNNLRASSRDDNAKNIRVHKTNTSGLMGVNWNKQGRKWMARIGDKSDRVYLGLFDTLLDAVCARKNAETKFGYHQNHNTVRPL